MVGPSGDVARGKKHSIAIDFHRSIRAGTRTQLISIGECHRDTRAILHPTLGGVIRPDLHGLTYSIVPHRDQPGGDVLAALGLEDQPVFTRGSRVNLRQRHISFLVRTER